VTGPEMSFKTSAWTLCQCHTFCNC